MNVVCVLAVCDRSHLKVSAYRWISDPVWVEHTHLSEITSDSHTDNNNLCAAAVMQTLLSRFVAATMRLLKKGSITPLNEFHLGGGLILHKDS